MSKEKVISIAAVMEKSGVNFGTSGVRGQVVDLSDEVCWAYAVGFIQYLQETKQLQSGATVGIAGDYRTSTDRMMGVLSQAIVDQGFEPVNLGKIPSPALALYGLKHNMPTMMVTGSHIPEDRNGIKFNTALGEILKPDEQGIRAQVITIPAGKFTPGGALVREPSLPPIDGSAKAEYVRRYLNFFPKSALQGLSIGLYEHSSVSRECLYEILTGLGARVMLLGRTDVFISVDIEAIRPEDIIHFRPSGNAPELRCYTESVSETRAVALNAACIQLMETWRLV